MKKNNEFDVIVIGGGPGGYVSAIRSAQLGYNVACIDGFINQAGNYSLGGTCLNVGCIPSKALLESSENYEKALHKFGDHGIKIKEVSLNLKKMQERKNKIVNQFTIGIETLLKKNKITYFKGFGSFSSINSDKYEIEVKNKKNTEKLSAKNIVIATGSNPKPFPGIKIDNQVICDNVGALSFTSVPKKLGIIGAGVIGLEMGSVWKRLGSNVTILEGLPNFLNTVDTSVSKEAFKIFTKDLGLDINIGCIVKKVEKKGKKVLVTFSSEQNIDHTLEFDKLIISIGRIPNSANIGAEKIGLKIDDNGLIEVDGNNKTNLPNVYAIGDVVRGPMLAHKSSDEGVAVAETIDGQKGHVNLEHIPWVIYTSPEIAWVGKTEQDLQKEDIDYKVGQFPFAVSGRAQAIGDTQGFVKMLADSNSDSILGVHIIGPFASELISEAVIALEFGACSEDIARIVHAHPSLSEVVHEAALGIEKRYLSL